MDAELGHELAGAPGSAISNQLSHGDIDVRYADIMLRGGDRLVAR
jgi:hypothetical protein